jgi:hypothetical protein
MVGLAQGRKRLLCILPEWLSSEQIEWLLLEFMANNLDELLENIKEQKKFPNGVVSVASIVRSCIEKYCESYLVPGQFLSYGDTMSEKEAYDCVSRTIKASGAGYFFLAYVCVRALCFVDQEQHTDIVLWCLVCCAHTRKELVNAHTSN